MELNWSMKNRLDWDVMKYYRRFGLLGGRYVCWDNVSFRDSSTSRTGLISSRKQISVVNWTNGLVEKLWIICTKKTLCRHNLLLHVQPDPIQFLAFHRNHTKLVATHMGTMLCINSHYINSRDGDDDKSGRQNIRTLKAKGTIYAAKCWTYSTKHITRNTVDIFVTKAVCMTSTYLSCVIDFERWSSCGQNIPFFIKFTKTATYQTYRNTQPCNR